MSQKAGAGPRRMARRQLRTVLLHPLVMLVTVGTLAVIVAGAVGVSDVLGAVGIPSDPTSIALILGIALGAFVVAVWHVASVFSGSASWEVGARAEQWTAKELALLGSGWHQFHGVTFTEGSAATPWEVDVDHIVVGPSGVLVVESKYCSSPLDLGSLRLPKRLGDAIVQAERNAGRVRALLARDAPDVPIRALVVYWGRWVTPPQNTVRRVDDVRVVHGAQAKAWRRRIADIGPVSPDAVAAATTKIRSYASL